jgi:RNA polymerase subunit RPABC4/transcription elongation factor Spt4
MPRMRVERKQCVACQHYMIEGISHRCTLEDNTYKNWLGMMYIEHPNQKNLRGQCSDYKPMEDHTRVRKDSGKGD